MSADDWQTELRSRGYRLTPQRQLVLDAVRRLGHGTPDEIAGAVQATAPSVNLSTVYRTLDLLEEVGLVTHTHLGHGAPTYHPADESDHVHLVCTDCGDILADNVAMLALARSNGARTRRHPPRPWRLLFGFSAPPE